MEYITLKANPFPKNQILDKLEEHSILINQYAKEFFAHPALSTEHTREMTIAPCYMEKSAKKPKLYSQWDALFARTGCCCSFRTNRNR